MEHYPWAMSCPGNVLICGPSGCGKMTFVEQLLRTGGVWYPAFPDKIYYCYGIVSENVKKFTDKFPGAILIEGIPRNLSEPLQMFSPSQNNLLIFDDLSLESQSCPLVTNFMVRGSHHSNTCFISLEHFLFSDNAKERRKQAPHWSQMILFRNNRALHQIGTLARQLSLGSSKSIQEAFKAATADPHGYLVIDMRNDTPEDLRLLSNVLGEREGEPVWAYKL